LILFLHLDREYGKKLRRFKNSMTVPTYYLMGGTIFSKKKIDGREEEDKTPSS